MTGDQDPFFKAALIHKYLKGDLSYDEEEELKQWLEQDAANQQLFDSLKNGDSLGKELQFFSSVDKDAAWQNLTKTINGPPQRPIRRIKYWQYAAAVLVLGILSYVVFEYTYNRERLEVVKHEVQQPKNDVLPGGNKATLTLADGTVVLLEDMTDGTVKDENGIRISKKEGQVVYEILNQEGSGEIVYNTIRTPVGGQYHVVLPDGSKVWLNAASSLHFPTAFTGSQRTVELTGEGYFEIAKKSGSTFVVQAEKTRVEVIGTHFNVMAYGNEGATRTTLLEGSVKVGNGVHSRVIAPGQQALTGNQIQVLDTDPERAVAWKNGYFQFESEDLKTILRQLKRWYDVEIENEHQIPDRHFTAFVSRNNTLSQVLKMLEMSGELKFKIEGKKISIQESQ
jgi:transmembrane sensor